VSANQPFAAMHCATASLAGVLSHQHQRCTQTKRGNARGVTSAHILVADYQPQDWSAIGRAGLLSMTPKTSLLTGAGFGRRTFSHSHRVAFPSLTHSRQRATRFLPLVVRAYSRCAGSNRARDLSAIGSGSRPAVGNTLADQQSVNAFADLPHLSINLSKASLRPTHIGRSEKEWRYLISVMRCPK
jgi:hypothetical protein